MKIDRYCILIDWEIEIDIVDYRNRRVGVCVVEIGLG